MAYAKASDVTTLWAKTPDTEILALIERRLEQVERMVKRRIPDVDTKVVADPVFKADLIDIEADAVLRLVRNPEGYLSEGDGSYNYMLRSDLSQGVLEILDKEWEILGIVKTRMTVLAPSIVMPT
ncbi:head-tail adaptor Ad1 [Mycobacterium phage Anthony]|uniref:Head-to-tail adaptor n=1 Tax=Mycobacterium phage Anthony TaxID=2599857 RepID=A0A5J6TKS3_9CAUD|nr:head-tail adaptor Ad1 [Mycobacterium phage Anthony]QFG10389.1 head-to-tail adaptor [Mycobacterium phage Anthony]